MDYWLLIYLYQCSANNAVLATVLSGKGLIAQVLLIKRSLMFVCQLVQVRNSSIIMYWRRKVLPTIQISLFPERLIDSPVIHFFHACFFTKHGSIEQFIQAFVSKC